MPEPTLPPIPFTPETLAQRWHCSADNVRAMCKKKRLQHFKVGRGAYRIPVAIVEAFEARCGLSSIEATGTQSGAKEAAPSVARFAPKIVMLP